jgi:hypothetical protein
MKYTKNYPEAASLWHFRTIFYVYGFYFSVFAYFITITGILDEAITFCATLPSMRFLKAPTPSCNNKNLHETLLTLIPD